MLLDSSSGFYQAGLNFPESVYFADYVPGRAESFQTVTSASHRLETNKWYSVKVTMIGDIFTMKIDDKVVMTASRDTLPQGGIGFITEGSEQFDVDDVMVWKVKK